VPFSSNSADLHIVVQALGDELNQHDQQLLQDIRDIATGHEGRSQAILDELQALAGSIGTLPPRETIVVMH
jgi:uncharacterized protein involved in exopolysaccharide biosynthesis